MPQRRREYSAGQMIANLLGGAFGHPRHCTCIDCRTVSVGVDVVVGGALAGARLAEALDPPSVVLPRLRDALRRASEARSPAPVPPPTPVTHRILKVEAISVNPPLPIKVEVKRTRSAVVGEVIDAELVDMDGNPIR